tara:strand:+ start:347 stop:1129 length:783 start_codon:yes stop_codon:yes gene_type:complete
MATINEGAPKRRITNLNGAEINVNVLDQNTRAFDANFSQVIGVPSTLTVLPAIDDWTITVSASHGIIVGDQLVVYDAAADRLYVGNVLVVATNVITLDTPMNFAYPIATSVVLRSTKEMNVDGSTTRQTFSISPPIKSRIDITRILIQMTTTNFPEMAEFGDITGGIVGGVVLRSVNGINVNYFNVKTNGELVNLMHDVNYYEAAKQGTNGLGGRLTYAGPSNHGVVIELGQDDSLEVIIQDDLSSLLSFRMIASGHVHP